MAALFLIAMVVVLLGIEIVRRQKVPLAQAAGAPARSRLHLVGHVKWVPIESLPQGLFFDRGHTWFHLEPSGEIRLGADLLPCTLLGDVQDLQLRAPGTELKTGEPILGMVKGGRTVTLYSPVEGRISEVNAAVAADPARLRRDPFGEGWVYRIAPSNTKSTLTEAFVGEEAASWMRGELERLRDFLALAADPGLLASATLPDGGLPVEGIEKHLDEESWKRLCREFFYRWPMSGGRK